MPPPPVPPPPRDDSSDGRLAQLLGERSLWQVLPTFVLLGIGLAFTPCMLPMLPILTGLIVDSGAGPRQATMLSLAFVLAMAATYATLGAAAALSALKQQGLAIVGPFQSAAGTTAWAGYIGDRPVALYPTPDGRHVIAGTLLDAQGKDADHERLLKAVGHALTDALWNNLADSRWIADGSTAAPRIVYVFTDPNCPYCNKFWSDARPWVAAGKVQLRHVIVGVLTPESPAKAAALLSAKDPSARLAAYEGAQAAKVAGALASGRARPLDDTGLAPLSSIPPELQRQLDTNAALMSRLGMTATPGVAWRDATGSLKTREGIPPQALDDVLGPR